MSAFAETGIGTQIGEEGNTGIYSTVNTAEDSEAGNYDVSDPSTDSSQGEKNREENDPENPENPGDPENPTEPEPPEEPGESEESDFREIVPVSKAAVRGEGIRVRWDPVEDATRYFVYRSYSAKGKKVLIAGTISTYYTDKKVKSGRNAYYFVRGVKDKIYTEYTQYSKPAKSKIIRIYIETGHGIDSKGKWDPGCTWKYRGRRYQEAKLMIPIAKAMTKYMRRSGVYVYTDAYSGNNTNLDYMIKFANNHSVSAVISLHCDYYKAKPGTLPLYRTAEQKKLAIALNKGVHNTIKIRNRGLMKRKDLRALNKVKAPSCIFETGSIKGDNKLLRTKYDSYGKGLAKGLCKYLNVNFTP
ncbi:MAG TPA: hypothetical protein GX736_00815 [Mogibacterium sp.]|nr:hypothetical protein [Mogibacterium sp.]